MPGAAAMAAKLLLLRLFGCAPPPLTLWRMRSSCSDSSLVGSGTTSGCCCAAAAAACACAAACCWPGPASTASCTAARSWKMFLPPRGRAADDCCRAASQAPGDCCCGPNCAGQGVAGRRCAAAAATRPSSRATAWPLDDMLPAVGCAEQRCMLKLDCHWQFGASATALRRCTCWVRVEAAAADGGEWPAALVRQGHLGTGMAC